jgi:hypothetical protein
MLYSVHFFVYFKIWLQLSPFFLLLYSKPSRYMVLRYTGLAVTWVLKIHSFYLYTKKLEVYPQIFVVRTLSYTLSIKANFKFFEPRVFFLDSNTVYLKALLYRSRKKLHKKVALHSESF